MAKKNKEQSYYASGETFELDKDALENIAGGQANIHDNVHNGLGSIITDALNPVGIKWGDKETENEETVEINWGNRPRNLR